MWRVGRMTPIFLMNHGFSIGIGDVRPSEELKRVCWLIDWLINQLIDWQDKQELVDKGNTKCDQMIRELRDGQLKTQPGCSAEQTLESLILKASVP